MRSPMDEKTFLDFYKNTMLSCSNNLQRFICKKLENEHRITFEEQLNIEDTSDTLYVESKKDFKGIITKTTTNNAFINFYEEFEFKKLYKYSVPFFYEEGDERGIQAVLEEKGITFFNEKYKVDYVIDRSLKEAKPIVCVEDNKIFIKFTLQKVYLQAETYEQIDYRYPIIIYINTALKVLEVRYDAMRFGEQFDSEAYGKIINACVSWVQDNLHMDLFLCEHSDAIKVINDKENADVKMYKQMMELSTGGSAELTASESADYLLPFIGEIRELIDENEDLFNEADEIKQILLQYINDKEATASYPYIYVKWVKPVESQSYIVKITFDYFNNKYTLLQHITGNCKDLGMERMNNAIEYLCTSSSFVKGEKI